MTEFVEGAYIDDQCMIHNADGSPDAFGRYVDERGYVHLSDGVLDGGWFIDAQGQPHDALGMPRGQRVGIPESWNVFYEPPMAAMSWQGYDYEEMEAAVSQQRIDERNAELSTTEQRQLKDGALEAFSAGLQRPPEAPYAKGYKTRPTWNADDDAPAAAQRRAEYAGEETSTTVYEKRDTIRERASGKDTEGRVVDTNAQPMADGQWGWVIDNDTGYLLLFDPDEVLVVNDVGVERWKRHEERIGELIDAGYQIRKAHHTTPVAGMPVTGAGLMRIKGGRIAEVSDESGHYRPQAPQEYAALQALMDRGYSLEQARVRLTGTSMGYRPTDKAQWINKARQTNPDFPTGDLTLLSEQFMQTEGDEYQIRMKQALNTEILARGEQRADDAGRSTSMPITATTTDYLNTQQRGTEQVGVQAADNAGTVSSQPAEDTSPTTRRTSTYLNVPQRAAEQEGDSSAEDRYVQQARRYLSTAGRSAFAEWFRTLPGEYQNLLLADPLIAAAWREENAPSPRR